MPFDSLPQFPDGGVARPTDGVGGIPPEAFQQALTDTGVQLIQSSKTPLDNPAVAAALGAEVDRLATEMGHPAPQQQQPQAPAPEPATPQGDPSAPAAPYAETAARPVALSDADLRARIEGVLKKYNGDPAEIAKAYQHANAAMTRAQQDRASAEARLQAELATLRIENDRLRTQPPTTWTPPEAQRFAAPQEPTTASENPEQFFQKPEENIARIVNRVVQQHLTAYTDAQRRYSEDQQFARMREQLAPEIQRLQPHLDALYTRDRDLYEALPRDRSLGLLLERAREREAAMNAKRFYDEIRGIFSGEQGTPAQAAPGQAGALPGPSTVRRAPGGAAPSGNWSDTTGMRQLWGSRSDSTDEMRALGNVLKERGFGEDIRNY